MDQDTERKHPRLYDDDYWLELRDASAVLFLSKTNNVMPGQFEVDEAVNLANRLVVALKDTPVP